MLEFLQLLEQGTIKGSKLEQAIINEMENFLLEMENEQLFASEYQCIQPTEQEVIKEIERENND